jgi:SAM-dependent methyltransferase
MFIEMLQRHLAVGSRDDALRLVRLDPDFWNVVSIFGTRIPKAVLPGARKVLYCPFDDIESPLDDGAAVGGHTALWLARQGWRVTAGDIAPRMLVNARKLCAEAGFAIQTRLFPAEEIPFPDGSFDLVTVRVAAHHFSSPERFVQATARVLKPGGHFLVIDGSVPDDDPETEEWLHQVEKWRDPSHGRFLSRKAWEELVRGARLKVLRSELHPRKQPDLDWYFETAATAVENRQQVLRHVQQASDHVRQALRLGDEQGKIVWWWPMLTMVASKT